MADLTVSAQYPPIAAGSVEYWERSSDPFHSDAFQNIGVKGAIVTVGGKISEGHRNDGWMAIDWCENPVGFVPDGTPIQGESGQYVIKAGPFGHLCAYPVGSTKIKEHEGQDWRSK